MKISDVKAAHKQHSEELAALQGKLAQLVSLVKSEELMLDALGADYVPALARAARGKSGGQLTGAILVVLADSPLSVSGIARKVIALGYVPATPGRHFEKTIRVRLHDRPDLFQYDAETGKWSTTG